MHSALLYEWMIASYNRSWI